MIKKVNGNRNLSGKKKHVDLSVSIQELTRLMLFLKSLKAITKKRNLKKRRRKRKNKKKKANKQQRKKKRNKKRYNKRKKKRRNNKKSHKSNKTINDR